MKFSLKINNNKNLTLKNYFTYNITYETLKKLQEFNSSYKVNNKNFKIKYENNEFVLKVLKSTSDDYKLRVYPFGKKNEIVIDNDNDNDNEDNPIWYNLTPFTTKQVLDQINK